MTTVLVIDPGARQRKGTLEKRGSGWAVIRLHNTRPPKLLDTALIDGGTDWLLHELTRDTPLRAWFRVADVVVVENFLHLNARANIEPLEMVGLVRGLCAANNKTCVVQDPAQRTIVSHDDLKRIDMWPGGKGHADEAQAVRHGLAWAMLQGNLPTIALLAPDPGDGPIDHPSGPGSW